MKRALVVEGGAMRGIFSTGVLDGFIDHQHRPFDFCIGVSAGSTNLAAWLANQRGRNYKVTTDYSCRPQFISLRKFLSGGHWLDLDWLWDISIREIPIDTEAFASQPVPLYVVATKVASGKAAYIRASAENLEQVLKASCSVPVAYRYYPIFEGESMTDGGVADSIPVIRAYDMGARDITVILSRPRGYRKAAPRAHWLIRKLLLGTPQLAEAMIHRSDSYNQAIDFIENPPSDCHVRVLAPPDSFAVGRMTKDQARLNAGYEMGLEAANQYFHENDVHMTEYIVSRAKPREKFGLAS